MASTAQSPIKPIRVPKKLRKVKIAFAQTMAMSQDIYNTDCEIVEMRPGQKPEPQTFGVNSVMSLESIAQMLLLIDDHHDGPISRAMREAGEDDSEDDGDHHFGGSGDFKGNVGGNISR